jgi:malate synthase
LAQRKRRQLDLDAGSLPGFPAETADIRAAGWSVAPVPDDLQDRRLEITGPVDRKMIINALNAPVKTFMADFEDSCSPTWNNIIDGQVNLRDAVRRAIEYTQPETGKHYALGRHPAVLIVRPRGWHLEEAHVLVDGEPIAGALFDFGLYFFHNAHALIEQNSGPYFYLPKLESHHEARLWNDVFLSAQDALGINRGTIKATVLIETILAAFEMDEILYELREHSAGLNCGRWDYIFSFIKKLRNHADFTLPDRSLVTMDRHFLKSYVSLLIQTCHRRGAHAMGGMAAQIPIKNDPRANAEAMAKVAADKKREAEAGHDGTWIAHPGLASVALQAFDAVMPGPNQLHVFREDVSVSAEDLLRVPRGEITASGLRHNIRVGVQYLEAWLGGNGCVPLYHLMEDAATAEICRTQIWQWLRHGAKLADGRRVTPDLIASLFREEQTRIREEVGPDKYASGRFELAERLFAEMVTKQELDEFLTLPAYQYIAQGEQQ